MILKLDFSSDIPIYQQIRNQIVLGVSSGELKPGEKIPTMRALADEAGINFMTENKAYALLKQEGIIITDRRNGARICDRVLTQREKETKLSESTQGALRLVIAEVKLAGMDREEFLKLCDRAFSDTIRQDKLEAADMENERED